MAFIPENALEESMLRAAADVAARPAFYRLLMESELHVMGNLTTPQGAGELAGASIALDCIRREGLDYHPLFSSPRRLADFAGEKAPFFLMRGSVLFLNTRGAAFVLNPGSELNKTLVPQEIAYWLAQLDAQDAAASLVVSLPKQLPKKLLKALCVLFTSRANVRAAHLAAVAREDAGETPHPLIALVTEGDAARLVSEVLAASAVAMPGTRVDVVAIAPQGPADELQRHLLKIKPFYLRTATLN